MFDEYSAISCVRECPVMCNDIVLSIEVNLHALLCTENEIVLLYLYQSDLKLSWSELKLSSSVHICIQLIMYGTAFEFIECKSRIVCFISNVVLECWVTLLSTRRGSLYSFLLVMLVGSHTNSFICGKLLYNMSQLYWLLFCNVWHVSFSSVMTWHASLILKWRKWSHV